MNEKIKEIEKFLMEWMVVSLSKQCKQEYIVYTFHINTKREKVIRQIKEPIYKSFVTVKLNEFWKDRIIKRITHIKIWENNWPTKFLSHILKIHDDWSNDNDKKAKGEMISKIFIKINLIE